MDRALRKEVGDLSAEGRLEYVVRDFDIIKLEFPRELPRRRGALNTTMESSVFGSANSRDASNALNGIQGHFNFIGLHPHMPM